MTHRAVEVGDGDRLEPAAAAVQRMQLVGDHHLHLAAHGGGVELGGGFGRGAELGAAMHDLEGAEDYDVLLTEIKAAAVDVASERAVAAGAQVIFTDNTAVAVDGTDLPAAFAETLDLARERREQR